ncbi:SBBP repeat-containing protein [Hymenobacter sp. 15J16-1T3B]|uniref:SBBP repeat-containing protein n=1 Tax=Hymenobacter sp. 15J16-1T3B TaxID=2886941 RepID=UPI001D1183C5|nr:SBBP repeat-containing protein [Hymenobacter sp. 15J16-1T3B]MCC3158890.1 SBBP repeat-containing protein [Hymenobacter sp. 15J16-1T3B]
MNVRLFLFLWAALGAALPSLGQNVTWRFTDDQPFSVSAVATDDAGYAYVAGQFSGTIALGQTTLRSRSDQTDVLVAKFSPQGRVVWATSLGPEPSAQPLRYRSTATAYDISVNPLTGEAYVVADFVGSISRNTGGGALTSFGVASPTATSVPSLLVIKCQPRGQVDWARRLGNDQQPATGYAIATDPAGNSYVTGAAGGALRFDDGYALTLGNRQLLVFSLDNDGRTRWATTAPSSLGATGLDIGLDAQQGCYVVGRFAGSLQWGSTDLANSGATRCAFVGRLHQRTGAMAWAKQGGGGSGNSDAQSIDVDALGNCLVAGIVEPSNLLLFGYYAYSGDYRPNGYAARLDANGTTGWVRFLGAVRVENLYKDVQVASLAPLPGLQQYLVAFAVEDRRGPFLALRAYDAGGSTSWQTTAYPTNPPRPGTLYGPNPSLPTALAVAPGGASLQTQVYLGGFFRGTVTLGSTTLTPPNTGFLAGLTFRYSRRDTDWSALRTYPNPAGEQLTVALPAGPEAQVVLYNGFGRAVRELRVPGSSAESSLTLDVHNLPAGLYTLRVSSGRESESRQVQVR